MLLQFKALQIFNVISLSNWLNSKVHTLRTPKICLSELDMIDSFLFLLFHHDTCSTIHYKDPSLAKSNNPQKSISI